MTYVTDLALMVLSAATFGYVLLATLDSNV